MLKPDMTQNRENVIRKIKNRPFLNYFEDEDPDTHEKTALKRLTTGSLAFQEHNHTHTKDKGKRELKSINLIN